MSVMYKLQTLDKEILNDGRQLPPPSRYSSLSLNISYLALEDGSPIIRAGLVPPYSPNNQ